MTVLRIDWQAHVAHVILSRPDRMNALDPALIDALVAAGEAVAERPGCRAVVLSGAGRAFCAGLDLETMAAVAAGATPFDIATPIADGANIVQHAVLLWQALPMPVIAAVHGVAFGGGFQLALGADIRIVRPDTRLSLMEAKWGLVPDMGAMLLLPRLVRADVLAELMFTARIFDGPEAAQLGLATRLADDPLAEALALAEAIAAMSPDAIRAGKRLLRREGARHDLLRAEAEEQAALIGTANQREAVAAGLAKRPPVFDDARSPR